MTTDGNDRRRTATAALDLLRAALDAKTVICDQLHRPGGPTTARAALDRVRDQLDRLDAVCDTAGVLDVVTEPAAPRPARRAAPIRWTLTTRAPKPRT